MVLEKIAILETKMKLETLSNKSNGNINYTVLIIMLLGAIKILIIILINNKILVIELLLKLII